MRKSNTKKIALRYLAIAFLVIFLISSVLFLLKLWESKQGRFPEVEIDESIVEFDGKEYTLKSNTEAFLLLGLDKFEDSATKDSYNNNMQADFICLFVFDNEKKQCSAIHINRDTMAEMNILGVAGEKVDTVTKQIALAHTYGNGKEVSCRNTADSVSWLLNGMKINNYLSLTLDSVPIINDLVGGVEVTVTEDFTNIDSTLKKGETVTLKGEHALNYVRTRYGLEDPTNSTRMDRQKQYMNALYKKLIESIENDSDFIVDASLKMSDYIVSNRSITQLQDIADKFSTYKFNEIKSLEGRSELGDEYIEFYPDNDSIEKLIIDLFYEPVK